MFSTNHNDIDMTEDFYFQCYEVFAYALEVS